METALARAALYNFLATAFGDAPTPELVKAAAQVLPDGNVPEARPSANMPESGERAISLELRLAYTRLLLGPDRGYVPPYASVYLSPAGNGKAQLWGSEAEAVEALYREAGLAIAPGSLRIPDHLALELQFMQHLCAREADAEARGEAGEVSEWRARQQSFLRDHLWPWLPRFVERAGANGTHPFYRALADFTLAFVQSDME